MANRNRTNPVQFYLSDDEQYILTTKFKASGMKSMSTFLRKACTWAGRDNYNYHKGMNGIIQKLKCLFMKRLGQIIRKWLNQNIRKFRSCIHRWELPLQKESCLLNLNKKLRRTKCPPLVTLWFRRSNGLTTVTADGTFDFLYANGYRAIVPR